MRKYLMLLLVILLFCEALFAQKDSLGVKSEKPLIVKTILPTALILTGALLTGKQVEKNWQADIRNKVGNDYHNGADDYIQYVPYAQIYLGDIVGMNAKNHWFDQTKNIFIGGLATLVVTHSLKRGVGKERPDGSSNHSFSSGHTATAFLGATINYHEYKDASMLYASSGYLFSSSTAGLRVVNNRHWVSDVVAGAGIGILVGNLIYHIEPLKNFNPFKNSKNISFTPMIDDKGFSFTAALQF
ncbi:MAG: phosphatase PAP2 family protein [Vicingaceae bacterium]